MSPSTSNPFLVFALDLLQRLDRVLARLIDYLLVVGGAEENQVSVVVQFPLFDRAASGSTFAASDDVALGAEDGLAVCAVARVLGQLAPTDGATIGRSGPKDLFAFAERSPAIPPATNQLAQQRTGIRDPQ